MFVDKSLSPRLANRDAGGLDFDTKEAEALPGPGTERLADARESEATDPFRMRARRAV